MIKILWILESLIVCSIGVQMEDTLLKIVVVLCGLISLILSITFGGLLKHLHQHNDLFLSLRTKEECQRMHDSMDEILEMKLEKLHRSVENVAELVKNGQSTKTES